jgi:methylmalonyl-CoA/ethylmalonyl-CoA epimerase
VAIAVKNLDEALRFYRDTLGLPVHGQAVREDQGVKAAVLTIGQSEIELLEPLGPDTAVGRFLERRGEGLHHICFQTDDIDKDLTDLKAKGVELIDQEPRQGLAGRICFLHPRSTKGVLLELAQPPD